MNRLLHSRGLLRPLIFSSCALAALANTPTQVEPISVESWLTRDDLRARDGSLLPLFEHRYTDVGVVSERTVPLRSSVPARSDYVDAFWVPRTVND